MKVYLVLNFLLTFDEIGEDLQNDFAQAMEYKIVSMTKGAKVLTGILDSDIIDINSVGDTGLEVAIKIIVEMVDGVSIDDFINHVHYSFDYDAEAQGTSLNLLNASLNGHTVIKVV